MARVPGKLTNEAMAFHHSLAAVMLAASGGLSPLSGAQMPDQHGGRDSLAAHRGNQVIVVVVDARRLGTVRRWEQDLMTRFPKLHILTVADVNEKRPTTVERVASVLNRRVPAEVTVLIDMERLWAREFELDTSAPNLVVFAPDGTLVARFRGRWTAELATEVGRSLTAGAGAA
jgi:hypothetical protein